ncbi:TATA-binding protein-associated factor 172 [Culicoides brevitarsis]|uniref:TATA-binding protein-associated factor 172 n=1 Tax=Culicoides brevitarsis TaxID=469753 RepID=UPI00307C1A41
MTSRLDRLFILLESGSAAVTRKAASRQIGEVQKLHPHELHNLLNRTIGYLHSNTWDTRVAAAFAIQAILENVPIWDPKPCASPVKMEHNRITEKYENTRLTFENFDLDSVLSKGARLLGSEGTEFDTIEENDGDLKERLLRQRALLSEKLCLNSGIQIDELITLEDMTPKSAPITSNIAFEYHIPVEQMLNLDQQQPLSCREINRAKRKARQIQLTSSSSTSSASTAMPTPSPSSRRSSCSSMNSDEPERKRSKAEIKMELVTSEPVPDATGSWGNAVDWPLETFCSKLFVDLFNPKWEIRHGSATALRELLKGHISGAGKSTTMTREEMEEHHHSWLEDALLRLLCVLALDRFGDFVSDQVVAPVRETCAQALGTVLKDMRAAKVMKAVETLLKFTEQEAWEVRHAGLLGLKYLVVVREDLILDYLPLILNHILKGLEDPVDDVAAVCASTLIPIANHLPKQLSLSRLAQILSKIWDLLLDQDELTTACNSFMGLLAAILSLPGVSNSIQGSAFTNLIPRLFPFLSHSSTSVRKSTLQTLKTLTDPVHLTNSDPKAPSNGTGTKNFCVTMIVNSVKLWPFELVQEVLRQLYQRVLVEHVEDVQNLVEDVWSNIVNNADLTALLHAACPFVSCWFCLAMQPARLAFDQSQLVPIKNVQVVREKKNKPHDLLDNMVRVQAKFYLGGSESVPIEVREKNVIRARFRACRMLGILSKYLVMPAPGVTYTKDIENPIQCYVNVLSGYLGSRSALQRMISALVVTFWAKNDEKACPAPPQLLEKLRHCLIEYVYYDEVAILFTRLLQEAKDFLATLKQYKIQFAELDASPVLTLDQILSLSTNLTENLRQTFNLKAKVAETLEDRRKNLYASYLTTSQEQNSLNITTQAILSGAIINLKGLPGEKFAPYVKPLLEAIKRENSEILQKLAGENLALLIDQVADKSPCPNSKIITSLCTILKCDPDFTPQIPTTLKPISEFDPKSPTDNPYHGVLLLAASQTPKITTKDMPNGAARSGRPSISGVSDVNDDTFSKSDNKNKQNCMQRIGASYTLSYICIHFAGDLPKKLEVLWALLFDFIEQKVCTDYVEKCFSTLCGPNEEINTLITNLHLIETVASSIHSSLHEKLFGLTSKLAILVYHPLKAIRHLVSRCLATLAFVDAPRTMAVIVNDVIPYLSAIENVVKRQGAAEAIACIVNKLQLDIVPYVVLLIVPLLGRMSDPDEQVRLICTQSFATLIQLMPLDAITPLSEDLKTRKLKDKEFLEYLFSPKSIPEFKMPVPIKAELRSYQQAGVNWLWFLNQYKLHGILCDDMGLGKTLQAICILAGDHHHRSEAKEAPLPSLVISPPTLTGHWVFEINKFISEKYLKPMHYAGLPLERERMRTMLKTHNLVVASYDIVRKDIDFFSNIQWNYCILDEGHTIKNGKTKCSKAIKQIVANHRLILSGTPIQNNVLELWSLFDFLMPGFLSTEKQFMSRFSRPILASRDPKSSAKEQEAGALAMEALHRQVLPFLLRRVKEDVLTDLPPKITQDLLCELSPLQERLYEDFSKEHLDVDIRDCLDNIDGSQIKKKTHIFQALRYLQNVCNHPKLVLNANHPEFKSIVEDLRKKNGSLDNIEHSAKLPALKQLLLDCGIGANEDETSVNIVNQHRALIFCQLKAMLDIIENDLLKKHLPSVTYLRLDGSVPANLRHSIVTKFNSDPSIDVLLLTTQVGGLGLNLTGADTVIFVEHDWNPMKDLQAMDRAHRIGQKKVVNVYRLITRKSLEEKIMGLQKFKLLTANTVVSDENASMETMGTDQLLDLFSLSDQKQQQEKTRGDNARNHTSVKHMMENLPELWEDQQYQEEYDLSSFIKTLNK